MFVVPAEAVAARSAAFRGEAPIEELVALRSILQPHVGQPDTRNLALRALQVVVTGRVRLSRGQGGGQRLVERARKLGLPLGEGRLAVGLGRDGWTAAVKSVAGRQTP